MNSMQKNKKIFLIAGVVILVLLAAAILIRCSSNKGEKDVAPDNGLGKEVHVEEQTDEDESAIKDADDADADENIIDFNVSTTDAAQSSENGDHVSSSENADNGTSSGNNTDNGTSGEDATDNETSGEDATDNTGFRGGAFF